MRPERLRVWVATPLLDAVKAELSDAFDTAFVESLDPAAAIMPAEGEIDAVLVSLNVPMGAGAIEALPSGVGAIATYSVGTDHIDLEAARRRGIAVFNTPGVLSDAVAENALLLMLGAARRVSESVELLRSRSWSGWSPRQLVGVGLAGRRLGILGLGEIGARIATRAQAFGMEILYCNRHRREDEAARGFSFRATPAELIEDADVFLIACPSTDETRGLVDAGLLLRARTGSILVNIARGDIVDDAALIDALRDGRVWAAGLDVFDGEPRIARGYFDLPNVFMLPHIGSSTLEARLGMGRILIEALETWRAGGSPANQVV